MFAANSVAMAALEKEVVGQTFPEMSGKSGIVKYTVKK